MRMACRCTLPHLLLRLRSPATGRMAGHLCRLVFRRLHRLPWVVMATGTTRTTGIIVRVTIRTRKMARGGVRRRASQRRRKSQMTRSMGATSTTSDMGTTGGIVEDMESIGAANMGRRASFGARGAGQGPRIARMRTTTTMTTTAAMAATTCSHWACPSVQGFAWPASRCTCAGAGWSATGGAACCGMAWWSRTTAFRSVFRLGMPRLRTWRCQGLPRWGRRFRWCSARVVRDV
mmetsp:Transcript_1421/g.4202  ORF Transcript_1421/g.4202 Transcript_1421/m.4202 type:complete len:234 (-) Transcript_1421:44-745(-)